MSTRDGVCLATMLRAFYEATPRTPAKRAVLTRVPPELLLATADKLRQVLATEGVVDEAARLYAFGMFGKELARATIRKDTLPADERVMRALMLNAANAAPPNRDKA